jgi:hypothetical protein
MYDPNTATGNGVAFDTRIAAIRGDDKRKPESSSSD